MYQNLWVQLHSLHPRSLGPCMKQCRANLLFARDTEVYIVIWNVCLKRSRSRFLTAALKRKINKQFLHQDSTNDLLKTCLLETTTLKRFFAFCTTHSQRTLNFGNEILIWLCISNQNYARFCHLRKLCLKF